MSIKNPLHLNGKGSTIDRLVALEHVVNALTDEMYEKRVKQIQTDIRETGEKVASIDETQKISFEALANGGQIDEQVVLAHKESISEWRYVDDKKKPVEYKLDQYVRHLDKLYKVIQEHTAQADWTPDIAPSLYEVIDLEHAGTLDDPIPFTLGMTVYADKYYTYEGVLYKCTRDSGIGLNNPPNELIGHYFEVV